MARHRLPHSVRLQLWAETHARRTPAEIETDRRIREFYRRAYPMAHDAEIDAVLDEESAHARD
jgi:hypothetical protein